METCCKEKMKFIAAYDDPGKTVRAYNLYMCESCGMLRKIDVWKGAGVLEIDVENNVRDLRG